MANETVVHIGENSAEHVAWKLYHDVMAAEGKNIRENTRKYLLDTYAECLIATKNLR
jgi:hypothetical protein